MDKLAFTLALTALVAFLMPVGVYCLLLASINRRPRPVMVNGGWDSVGLLFAASGFLLVTIPMLFTEFYRRTVTTADGEQIVNIWLSQWALWLGYFLFVVCAGWLMVLWRRAKTIIYNVDPEFFPRAMEQTLVLSELEGKRHSAKLILVPAIPRTAEESTAIMEGTAKPANPPTDHRRADLEIESFPSMCHVTLHWGPSTPGMREQVERELAKNLEAAAPLENAAAGWFLSVSGLILGAVSAIVVAMVFLMILSARER